MTDRFGPGRRSGCWAPVSRYRWASVRPGGSCGVGARVASDRPSEATAFDAGATLASVLCRLDSFGFGDLYAAAVRAVDVRATATRGHHASLSHPQLRRVAHRPCRRDGAPVRLGAPQARSRAAAVHRSARPLRHHPGRVPARASVLCGRRERAPGERAHGDRPRGRAQPRDGQPEPADRRGRGGRRRPAGRGAGRAAAAPGQRRARLSRRHPPALSLPRPAARVDAAEHPAALARDLEHPAAHGGSRASSSSRRRS